MKFSQVQYVADSVVRSAGSGKPRERNENSGRV